MKTVILVLALVGASFAASFIQDARSAEWQAYKKEHEKMYHSPSEEMLRFNIWKMNMDRIEHHNAEYEQGKYTFTLGMNRFGDLTEDEFAQMYLGLNTTLKSSSGKSARVHKPNPNVELPDNFDWRDYGAVSAVKDQGSCGSCYAFATTGAIEAHLFIAFPARVLLSEQNIVDCSNKFGNQGCNGGLMTNSYKYIIDNEGIDTEESYPYEEDQGKCRYEEDDIGAQIEKYAEIKQNSEADLQDAVANVGPVAVGINANFWFQLYKSGVFNGNCPSNTLNHAVLVVGYGYDSASKLNYWIVKNSWAKKWGEQGYMRIARNTNKCGIAVLASYPLISDGLAKKLAKKSNKQ